MTSLLLGALLNMSVASADVVVKIKIPAWHSHRHQAHCKHRPPIKKNAKWVFVPGHWNRISVHKKVWVAGHWKSVPHKPRHQHNHHHRPHRHSHH